MKLEESRHIEHYRKRIAEEQELLDSLLANGNQDSNTYRMENIKETRQHIAYLKSECRELYDVSL